MYARKAPFIFIAVSFFGQGLSQDMPDSNDIYFGHDTNQGLTRPNTGSRQVNDKRAITKEKRWMEGTELVDTSDIIDFDQYPEARQRRIVRKRMFEQFRRREQQAPAKLRADRRNSR